MRPYRQRDESGLGSVFFSAKDFQRVNGLADYLAQYKYTHPAIIPDMTWKTGEIPQEPQNIRSVKRDGTYYLKWDYTTGMNDRFAVYSTIEAMDSRGLIRIRTDIVLKGYTSYCRIQIRDDGIGISSINSAKVFHPYFTTKEEGTGLGLSIIERIIFDHKGRIWLESQEGSGTTFYIDIPVEVKR